MNFFTTNFATISLCNPLLTMNLVFLSFRGPVDETKDATLSGCSRRTSFWQQWQSNKGPSGCHARTLAFGTTDEALHHGARCGFIIPNELFQSPVTLGKRLSRAKVTSGKIPSMIEKHLGIGERTQRLQTYCVATLSGSWAVSKLKRCDASVNKDQSDEELWPHIVWARGSCLVFEFTT